MKTYKGVPWDEFMAFIGDSVKDELEKLPIGKTYGFSSVKAGYGRFGAVEANYTLRECRGLLGRLIGLKIFSIHGSSAEDIGLSVKIHDDFYFGQKAKGIFQALEKNLGIELKVECN